MGCARWRSPKLPEGLLTELLSKIGKDVPVVQHLHHGDRQRAESRMGGVTAQGRPRVRGGPCRTLTAEYARIRH